MKKIITVMFMLLMTISLAACGADSPEPAKNDITPEQYKDDKIELVYDTAAEFMKVGDEIALEISVSSENGYDYTIEKMESSDESVITVSDNTVKAVGVGQAKITVTVSNKTMPRSIPVTVVGNTIVSFFNPDEVEEHLNSYSWAPYNPAALGNGNYIIETDTQTDYISGIQWMTGDKHSVNTAWNRFDYSTSKWTRNFELGFGSTGHRIIICLDIAEKDKVTAVVYDGDTMYNYEFSKGYLVKAPENGPAWLDDEAAVSEFISMSNEYLAAVDYTIDDVFDINAFLTAVSE